MISTTPTSKIAWFEFLFMNKNMIANLKYNQYGGS